eukprot:8546806-Alexandrium_andersonii.AAC.1
MDAQLDAPQATKAPLDACAAAVYWQTLVYHRRNKADVWVRTWIHTHSDKHVPGKGVGVRRRKPNDLTDSWAARDPSSHRTRTYTPPSNARVYARPA